MRIIKYIRFIHAVFGASLAVYFYSPLGSYDVFTQVIQYILMPLTVLSGLYLWFGVRIFKKLKK